MLGKINFVLILAIVLNIVPATIQDPCDNGGGVRPFPAIGPPEKVTPCKEMGGYCYNDLCKNCTDGHIRDDLCGDDVRAHRKCCLPGPAPNRPCCEIYSDPHIRTFDGYYYDVQEKGYYNITKRCDSDEFMVLANFTYPYNGAIWTEIDSIIVIFANNTIAISDYGVIVDGVTVTTFSHWVGSSIHITKDGPNIYLNLLQINVLVCFNIETRRLTVYIDAQSFFGKMCGLCLNYDNNISNDKDEAMKPTAQPKCPNERDHSDWSQCRKLLTEAMAECPPSIGIHRYLESCAFDMCAGGRKDATLTLAAAKEFCATYGTVGRL